MSGLIEMLMTVRTSITRRVHRVGRDRVVGILTAVSIKVEEGESTAQSY